MNRNVVEISILINLGWKSVNFFDSLEVGEWEQSSSATCG